MCLALCGCAHKVVYVDRMMIQDIDDRLFLPCPIEEPTTDTVRELRRVAIARKQALELCNIDKKELKAYDK